MTTDRERWGGFEFVRGEWQESGFLVSLGNDFGDTANAIVSTTTEAKELLAALEPLREWVAEGERERRAYDAASEEERERVMRIAPEIARESQAVWESLWGPFHLSTGEPARGPEGVEPVDGSRP